MRRVHWTDGDELRAACGTDLASGAARAWSRDPLKVTCDRCAALQAFKLARIAARKRKAAVPARRWWD